MLGGLDGFFQNSTLPALETTLRFAQARHQVLAGNLANLDTPGYRVRDLSPEVFQERLREALELRDASPSARELAGLGSSLRDADDPIRRVGTSLESLLRHDENDFGLEQQVAAMAKNQSLHGLATSLLVKQFRILQTAISEQVRP